MTDARDATTKDLFTYVTYAVMHNELGGSGKRQK